MKLIFFFKAGKFLTLLFVLTLASLACLDTSAAIVATPQRDFPIPTVTRQPVVSDTNTPASSPEPARVDRCAFVVAETAVHLRDGADPRARILTHLRKGDDLHVIDASRADWWQVTRGGYIGFVNVAYLQGEECEK
jgi:uncharacterized protein YgiM (DUF1202 family)